MILLTVGTTSVPFDRLLQIVDSVMVEERGKERLIAQIGPSTFKFQYPYVDVQSIISFPNLRINISRARAIITHGGAGSILVCLGNSSVKPFVVPRLVGEHVDNHQLHFTQFLAKKSCVCYEPNDFHLQKALKTYIASPPTHRINSKKMLQQFTFNLSTETEKLINAL